MNDFEVFPTGTRKKLTERDMLMLELRDSIEYLERELPKLEALLHTLRERLKVQLDENTRPATKTAEGEDT
jgi:hypothetical protein